MVTQTPTIKSPFKLYEEIKEAQKTFPDITNIATLDSISRRAELFGAMNVIWYLISGDEKEWQEFLKGEGK